VRIDSKLKQKPLLIQTLATGILSPAILVSILLNEYTSYTSKNQLNLKN